MAFDLSPLPAVRQENFGTVPKAEIKRSVFSLSHGYQTTFDASYLIPIFAEEYLPGDTWNLKMTAVGRLSTPLHPVMDNMEVSFFFFSCPNRLLWENWQKFQGEQIDPGDSIDYTVPQVSPPASGQWDVHSLADYFGLRAEAAGVAIAVNALHFRMYNLVYNQFFRDQNLIDSVTVNVDDGPDTYTDYALLKRAKRADYFTSALPWPQKGDAVEVPLGTDAPVLGIGVENNTTSHTSQSVYESGGTTPVYAYAQKFNAAAGTAQTWYGEQEYQNGYPNIRTDLSSATAATINEWREAFQLQRLLERDARSGTRYCEILQSHWGVTDPSNAVLQRPEYIGGGRAPVGISAVAQTESSDASTAQGTLTGVGTMQKTGISITKSFTEHGCLLGLACLTGSIKYQQGVRRMWNRRTRYDYYMPVLANLGEQEILNKEIYVQNTSADDDVFGYQERWAEYRCKMSEVTGKFRSDYGSSLDSWHLAPDFSALPVLNQSFIEDETPIDRVIAVPAEDHMIFDAWYDIKVARAMPTFSVPGMIDHF